MQLYVWVIVFFVWLIFVFWVVQLILQICFVFFVVVQNIFSGCLLGIGIDVYFYYVVVYGVFDFLSSRIGIIVENEVQVVVWQVMFFRNIVLRIMQNGWGQNYVIWFVNVVYVIEGSGNGEMWVDFVQFSVCVINVFWLGVQGRSVYVVVVYVVFFVIGVIQFDFQSYVNFGYVCQVFGVDFDVFVQRFFRQVNYVRREQWFIGSCKVFFICIQQIVDLWQQFFCVVVSVQDNWNVIMFSYLMNVMCVRDSVQDCCVLRYVSFYVFICDEGCVVVGELNDDWCFNFCSGFQNSVDGISVYVVNCWQSKIVFFCYLEYFLYVIISDYVWFYEIKNFRYVLLFCIVGFWEKIWVVLNVRLVIN